MRIESNRQSGSVSARSGTARNGATRTFTPYDPAPQAGPARPAMAAGPVTALDAILALQGVGDGTEGRRRAVRRGRDLLDGLDALKADLLTGRVEAENLAALSAQLAAAEAVHEPGLAAVLGEIELRVAVELAKLEQRG